MAPQRRPLWFSRAAAALAAVAFASGCAGSGQSNGMVPLGGSGFSTGGTGNTLVRIFVPAGTPSSPVTRPIVAPLAAALYIRSAHRAGAGNGAGRADARRDAGSAWVADVGDQRQRADDDQSKRYRRTKCERLHSGAGRHGRVSSR